MNYETYSIIHNNEDGFLLVKKNVKLPVYSPRQTVFSRDILKKSLLNEKRKMYTHFLCGYEYKIKDSILNNVV